VIPETCRAASGPHRPYEGSQRQAHTACTGWLHEVLIAPTRDRNTRRRTCSSPGTRWSSSPLRGIATGVPLPPPLAAQQSSSPLRGIATGVPLPPPMAAHQSSSPLRGIATWGPGEGHRWTCSPHRPYEGSQPDERGPGRPEVGSPHRPYEGSQHAPDLPAR